MRAFETTERTRMSANRRTTFAGLSRVVKSRYLYLALVPSLALLLLFEWYPALSAMYNSLFQWNGGSVHRFIGFQNYVDLAHDQEFLGSIKNMVFFVVFRIVAQLVMPLIAAELIINLRSRAWAEHWKIIFVVPMVAPYLVMLLIWQYIYSPQLGLLNQLLGSFGLEGLALPWLSNPKTALWALAFVRFPWLATLQFLILLGALQSISRDVIDSSEIDGASLLSRVMYIDIPIIMPQIKLVMILTAIFMVQRFELFLVLTDGGPGYVTLVPALHLYHSAFNYLEFGYASSIGVVLFLILLVMTVFTLRTRGSQEDI